MKKKKLVLLLASAVSALENEKMKGLLSFSESNATHTALPILNNIALHGTGHAELVEMLAKGEELYESEHFNCSGVPPTSILVNDVKEIKEEMKQMKEENKSKIF